MNSHVFTHQKNMMFDDCVSLAVLALIFDEFWHRVWFHGGTPLVSKSCFFAIMLLMIRWIECLLVFDQKGDLI